MPDRQTEQKEPQSQFWRQGPTGADFHHEEVVDKCVEKATRFIQENKAQPFFLYLPLTAPHTPVLPAPRFKGKSNTTVYGDFVLQVDDVVKSVLETLRSSRLDQEIFKQTPANRGTSTRTGPSS